jgi:hypothetical protein
MTNAEKRNSRKSTQLRQNDHEWTRKRGHEWTRNDENKKQPQMDADLRKCGLWGSDHGADRLRTFLRLLTKRRRNGRKKAQKTQKDRCWASEKE